MGLLHIGKGEWKGKLDSHIKQGPKMFVEVGPSPLRLVIKEVL